MERRLSTSLVLRSSVAFIAGFIIVFTALGASATLVVSLLLRHLSLILEISGVLIIVLGLASTGLLRVPLLARERRFDLARIPQGPKGVLPLGMAFAFGWTPCIGPVLATVLAVAATSSTVIVGAVLLALYSVGLGLPFLALAVGFSRARTSLGWFRRRGRVIEVAGGRLLVGVGVMFVTGEWKSLFIPLQARFARLGWPPL